MWLSVPPVQFAQHGVQDLVCSTSDPGWRDKQARHKAVTCGWRPARQHGNIHGSTSAQRRGRQVVQSCTSGNHGDDTWRQTRTQPHQRHAPERSTLAVCTLLLGSRCRHHAATVRGPLQPPAPLPQSCLAAAACHTHVRARTTGGKWSQTLADVYGCCGNGISSHQFFTAPGGLPPRRRRQTADATLLPLRAPVPSPVDSRWCAGPGNVHLPPRHSLDRWWRRGLRGAHRAAATGSGGGAAAWPPRGTAWVLVLVCAAGEAVYIWARGWGREGCVRCGECHLIVQRRRREG